MKHFTRRLLTLTMAPSMTGSAAALAAEATPVDPAPPPDQSPAISVQLDGQALTFTDAVPQVVDQRTFLPFRAVFEAMGAEVSNADSTITAVRGDTTLTMKLGETAATVIKNGVETPPASTRMKNPVSETDTGFFLLSQRVELRCRNFKNRTCVS